MGGEGGRWRVVWETRAEYALHRQGIPRAPRTNKNSITIAPAVICQRGCTLREKSRAFHAGLRRTAGADA